VRGYLFSSQFYWPLACVAGKFLGRCSLFSLLWVLTNYLYVYSLTILGPTEVVSLFATNVTFVYILSWVILHEQFVGIRVSFISRKRS